MLKPPVEVSKPGPLVGPSFKVRIPHAFSRNWEVRLGMTNWCYDHRCFKMFPHVRHLKVIQHPP